MRTSEALGLGLVVFVASGIGAGVATRYLHTFADQSATTNSPSGHDSDASVTLDSDCKTLTVTDTAHAHRGNHITWEVRSHCAAANGASPPTPVSIEFDPDPNHILPFSGCPCSNTLKSDGTLDLKFTIDRTASLSVPFKYKFTVYGVPVDPILEIDP